MDRSIEVILVLVVVIASIMVLGFLFNTQGIGFEMFAKDSVKSGNEIFFTVD